MFRITFITPDGRRTTSSVGPEEHLLDAGLAAGLELPSSCLQGWCLTCAARLVEGAVTQADSRRYFPADQDAGFVLLCTARALSDVIVQTHGRDAMAAAREEKGLPYPKGTWGTSSTGDWSDQ